MKSGTAIWIIVVIAIILLYGLLNPALYPFPRCPFLTITGWKCPGCGAQRALHLVLHGDFMRAFQYHPLFIPTMLYVLFGLYSRVFQPNRWPRIRSRWYGRHAAWIWLLIIVVFWIIRNTTSIP